MSDGDATIALDERYLVVTNSRNAPPPGLADMYVTFRSHEGKWSELLNMGAAVNSPGAETAPILSPDGRYLCYTSRRYSPERPPSTYAGMVRAFNEPLNGYGDSFWVDAKIIERLQPQARW